MTKARIDSLVRETFDRLIGATTFIDVVDKAIPDVEFQEREALQKLAENQGWDFGDYQVESDILDRKLGHWVPRLAAYSAIILLHSILETQLLAYAERIGKTRGLAFRVTDMKGRAIEQARLYLERVALKVEEDPAWTRLRDLQELRNIIVHRAGKPGDSSDHQKTTERLVQAYRWKLSLADSGEIWISMHLCRDFAREIEGFFRRLFKAAGLPDKGVQFVP